MARALDAGVLSINSNTSVRVATPFGGFKQSGYGRELGPHALDAYTEVKSIFYSPHERGVAVSDGSAEPLAETAGKVCVITGAAGGIGAATAAVFAREGARVVGVDLLEHAVGELALVADVADEAERRRRCTRAYARGARPDRRAVQQRRHLADR